MDLVVVVYRLTERLPADERFGLSQQLRRAAVSVPSNIAEGEGRNSPGDFKRFLAISHGSLREVETQLMITALLGYLSEENIAPVLESAAEIGRMIQGLARSLK